MFVSYCSSSFYPLYDSAVKYQFGSSSSEVRPQPSLGTGRDSGFLRTLVAPTTGPSQVIQCPREGCGQGHQPSLMISHSFGTSFHTLKWLKVNFRYFSQTLNIYQQVCGLSTPSLTVTITCLFFRRAHEKAWSKLGTYLPVFSWGLIWLSSV